MLPAPWRLRLRRAASPWFNVDGISEDLQDELAAVDEALQERLRGPSANRNLGAHPRRQSEHLANPELNHIDFLCS